MTSNEDKRSRGTRGVGDDALGRDGERPSAPGRAGDEPSARDAEERVERLLQTLEPVDLPPFFRARLLARVKDAGRTPAWRDRLRAPQFAWSVASVCVVALVIVLVYSTRTTTTGTTIPVVQAVESTVDVVAPAGNSVVGAGDVEIVAAIHPPIQGAIVRLYVDERDVTGIAEVTESYVMYSPSERFEEGEHIVTIEITDSSGRRLKDVSWLFYTLNGEESGHGTTYDPRT
ncbi:MAG: hypothetical protein ABIG03_02140 [Candidatus Eisenbacteria bacterium]